MSILSITTMRNEGPFVLEWIAYHRLIGVTDFIVFSNDCDDGTDRLLDMLAAQGILRHIPIQCGPDESVQWHALKYVHAHRLTAGYDWALFSDCDEFPVIHVGQHKVQDALAAIPADTDAIALPWRLFGASGIVTFDDSPVIQQFVHSAPLHLPFPIAGCYIKSLFRPEAFQKAGIHRPKHKPNRAAPRWVDGGGVQLPESFAKNDNQLALKGPETRRSVIEMNHYSLRSVESFLVKMGRGLPNRRWRAVDLSYWVERNFNTQKNPAIMVLLDPLLAEIEKLASLSGVAACHAQSVAWHRDEISRIRHTESGYRLFVDCILASNSYAMPRGMAVPLHQLYQSMQRVQSEAD